MRTDVTDSCEVCFCRRCILASSLAVSLMPWQQVLKGEICGDFRLCMQIANKYDIAICYVCTNIAVSMQCTCTEAKLVAYVFRKFPELLVSALEPLDLCTVLKGYWAYTREY